MTEETAAAGWYPDPEMTDTQRYWDGQQWTDQRVPKSSRGTTSATITWGILRAVAAVALVVALVEVLKHA